MAERKKGTKPQSGAAASAPEQERSKETPAKRDAESKSGKGSGSGGSGQAKKAESKGRAQATKKAESGTKAEPRKAKTKESAAKSGGAKATSKTADAKASEKGKKGAAESKKAKAPAKAKAETPASRKAAKKEAPERPVVNARARYVRVAPRKARLVADQVRGMALEEAMALLRFHPRTASRDIAKLLDSAAANAEANHELVADELRISDITVDEGPTLRRYRPRALGRATKINKRTSHIKVALTPED